MTTLTNPSLTESWTQPELVAALNDVLMHLPARMEVEPPKTASVSICHFHRDIVGGPLRAVEIRVRTGIVVAKSQRPGRLAPALNTIQPCEALRSFLAGPGSKVWDEAPDAQVYSIAARAATASGLGGESLRTLARVVAAALGTRCGLNPPDSGEMA